MSKHRRHLFNAAIVSPAIGLAVATFASATAVSPASAEGLFDFFFAPQRPSPPSSASAYADPTQQLERKPREHVEQGPALAYCVRLCDGRFFPIQRNSATPVEVCNSFCPASQTKVFSGGSIEHAVARDGTHYSDLSNANVYRDKIVPGCTCNGKDAFGLAEVKATEDPTLRPGDVVATDNGFMTYTGGRRQGADFTPIDQSKSGLSAQWRRELSQTPIASSAAAAASPASGSSSDDRDRRAQNDR